MRYPDSDFERVFDGRRSETLRAALDTLIPADEHGPSATAAGVDRYVENMLATTGATGLREFYEANLAALDRHAIVRGEADGFVGGSPAVRESLMREVEQGDADGFTPDPRTFFATLREHAVQGLLGDPCHGGNVDFAGWQLIGYRGPLLVHEEADQLLGPVPERPFTSRADALPR